MNKIITLVMLLFLALCKIRAQVPYGLNSFPEASATVYLDFDGHTVTSILWLSSYNGGNSIPCSPTNLTNAQMIKVFNHVAEDFSPFNINVTTDSAVFLAAPVDARMRVIFTTSSSWYGSSGGVAYIDSWRFYNFYNDETPCFVFTSILGNNDKRVAEAASHEVGHTLGLYHQSQYSDVCVFQAEYFAGRGFGDIGWAPIMGDSYDRNLTIWHNGRSSLTCSFLQDNLATITNPLNKVTFRKDDYTNLRDSAKYVKFTSGNYKIDGVINDSADADFFKFGFTTPGRFIANINPYNTGAEILAMAPLIGVTNYNGNVDLSVTLYKDNTIIGVYNPVTRLNASIDTLLNSGTYYLRISSAENVNIYKYGMLGSYTLSGSFGGEIALPIRQVNLFCNNLQGGIDALSWNIISDEPLESIEIQVSRDGIVWNRLTNVSVTSTNYSYKAPGNRTLYYRLLVKSIVGELKFSNQCIINKSGGQASFTIANAAIINEGVEGSWRLFDVYGNIVLSGRLMNGINYINSNKITPGFYVLQVIDSVGNITSKKVIR